MYLCNVNVLIAVAFLAIKCIYKVMAKSMCKMRLALGKGTISCTQYFFSVAIVVLIHLIFFIHQLVILA